MAEASNMNSDDMRYITRWTVCGIAICLIIFFGGSYVLEVASRPIFHDVAGKTTVVTISLAFKVSIFLNFILGGTAFAYFLRNRSARRRIRELEDNRTSAIRPRRASAPEDEELKSLPETDSDNDKAPEGEKSGSDGDELVIEYRRHR